MDAYEAIIKKRDRREYDGRPIPEDVMRRILQAGRMAGSSSDSQPLRFIVMREQAAKDRLAPAGPGTAPLVNAPLGIVVCLKRGSRDFDVGRAAQNMMLAAWNEGIGSTPNGLADRDAARAAVDLDAETDIATVLSFGYPARIRDPGARSAADWSAAANRRPIEDVVRRA